MAFVVEGAWEVEEGCEYVVVWFVVVVVGVVVVVALGFGVFIVFFWRGGWRGWGGL